MPGRSRLQHQVASSRHRSAPHAGMRHGAAGIAGAAGASGAPWPAVEVGVALLLGHLLNQALHPHLRSAGQSWRKHIGGCDLTTWRCHHALRGTHADRQEGWFGWGWPRLSSPGPHAAPPRPHARHRTPPPPLVRACRCRGSHHQASAATLFSSSCLPCAREEKGAQEGAFRWACKPGACLLSHAEGKGAARSQLLRRSLLRSPARRSSAWRSTAQHSTAQRSVP